MAASPLSAQRRPAVSVAIAGPAGVGKTSLLGRQLYGEWRGDSVSATIGADVASVAVETADAQEVLLTIHDTAGQERFQALAPAFLRCKHVLVLVYDLSDPSTWERLRSAWLPLVRDNAAGYAQLLLVGNKADVLEGGTLADEDREAEQGLLAAFREQFGGQSACPSFHVSAKSGLRVEALFGAVALAGREAQAAEAAGASSAPSGRQEPAVDLGEPGESAPRNGCCSLG